MSHGLNKLHESGFQIFNDILSADDISNINKEISDYLSCDYPGVVYEKDGVTPRAIHGAHLFNDYLSDIARHPEVTRLVRNYFGEDIYIHQLKVNFKMALNGKHWPWHQDFIYWKRKDYIQQPKLMNVGIALDDVELLSGPLCVIPGSHKFGCLTEDFSREASDWDSDLSENLTYQISREKIASMIEELGTEFLILKAGDVFFFDPQLVHSSSNNLSPSNRKLFITTYNVVSNKPTRQSERPNYISATDYEPIVV
jgi:ectoine hydroxylase